MILSYLFFLDFRGVTQGNDGETFFSVNMLFSSFCYGHGMTKCHHSGAGETESWKKLLSSQIDVQNDLILWDFTSLNPVPRNSSAAIACIHNRRVFKI